MSRSCLLNGLAFAAAITSNAQIHPIIDGRDELKVDIAPRLFVEWQCDIPELPAELPVARIEKIWDAPMDAAIVRRFLARVSGGTLPEVKETITSDMTFIESESQRINAGFMVNPPVFEFTRNSGDEPSHDYKVPPEEAVITASRELIESLGLSRHKFDQDSSGGIVFSLSGTRSTSTRTGVTKIISRSVSAYRSFSDIPLSGVSSLLATFHESAEPSRVFLYWPTFIPVRTLPIASQTELLARIQSGEMYGFAVPSFAISHLRVDAVRIVYPVSDDSSAQTHLWPCLELICHIPGTTSSDDPKPLNWRLWVPALKERPTDLLDATKVPPPNRSSVPAVESAEPRQSPPSKPEF